MNTCKNSECPHKNYNADAKDLCKKCKSDMDKVLYSYLRRDDKDEDYERWRKHKGDRRKRDES